MRTFCTYCGAANADGAAACYACGTPIEAPKPQAPAPPTVNLGTFSPPGPPSNSATPPFAPSSGPLPPPATPGHEWRPPLSPSPSPPYQPPAAGQYPYPLDNRYHQGLPPPGVQPSAVPPWPAVQGYPQQPVYGAQGYTPQPGYGAPANAYGQPPYPAPYAQQPGYGPGYVPAPYPMVPGYGGMPIPYGQPMLATAGQRFGAYLLDSVVVGIPMFVLLMLVGATSSVGLAMLWMLLAIFGPALYFITSWATSGRTVGYRAMGLQLVRTDGTQPGAGSAIARYLGVVVCSVLLGFFLIPGLLGVMWMLWDNKKQTWYDKMADTLVIKP